MICAWHSSQSGLKLTYDGTDLKPLNLVGNRDTNA